MTNLSAQPPRLRAGWHFDRTDGACLMEYVSMLAGVRFTTRPAAPTPCSPRSRSSSMTS